MFWIHSVFVATDAENKRALHTGFQSKVPDMDIKLARVKYIPVTRYNHACFLSVSLNIQKNKK